MRQLDDLLSEIRAYNEKYAITEKSSEGDKLRHRIMQKHTNEEYLALQEELIAFVASNPPEEIAKLEGCGESLEMICSAIRAGSL